ncbi:MAG: hypothetical protein COB98_01680 [Flavobacteriaceae bacterium]|nr:MAG: hypothetical protein COB98_01680 [Flavobacteriaceae bacterium]
MVRVFSCILIVALLQSCCYRGLKSSYGFPRKDISKKVLLKQGSIDGVDTKHLYVEKYILTNIGKKINVLKENGSSFLKFYPSGKVSSFPLVNTTEYNELIPNYQFKKSDFDPRKSFMGYYYLKEGAINMLGVHFAECNARNIPSKITVKGDTLFVRSRKYGQQNLGTKVYVKSDIPVGFLEGWEPDW